MDFIKTQRVKFTIAMTLIVSAFLLILLGGFFCVYFASYEIVQSRAIDRAIQSPDTYNQFAQNALRCFYVDIDKNDCVKVLGDQLDFYGNDEDEIIKTAIKVRDGKFKAGSFYFICKSANKEEGTLIAIIDRTAYHDQYVNIGIQIALLYCLAVALAGMIAFVSSNTLLTPVSDAFNKQRDLIANASHELKTPLTVIAANLAVIKSEPDSTVDANAKWIDSIDSQIARMQELIQNMLELSKLEQTELKTEELDFSLLAEGVCLQFEAVCFEKQIELLEDIQPDIKIMGEKTSLERLIIILLDNAIKYGGDGGKVGIKLSADQKKAKLSVINAGEAITKEEAAHVFDRFYRTDGARKNEDKHSFGLGLSIAAATVKAHGGTISCEGIENKGTVFTVVLPLKPKQKKTSKKDKKRRAAV